MAGTSSTWKTTAGNVRTGHVIELPWDSRRRQFEIAWTIRERFISPEGVNTAMVWRFAGWLLYSDGSRAEWKDVRGGQRLDNRVYVVGDRRVHRDAFGVLDGGPVPVDPPESWAPEPDVVTELL